MLTSGNHPKDRASTQRTALVSLLSFNITFHFYRYNLTLLSAWVKAIQYTRDRARMQLGFLPTSSFVIKLFSLLGKNNEGHAHPWCLVLSGYSSSAGSARSGSGKSDPDTQWNLQVGDYPECT